MYCIYGESRKREVMTKLLADHSNQRIESLQYNAALATTDGIRLIQRKTLQELDLEFLQQKSFLKIFDNGSPNYPTFIISTIILYYSSRSYHTITPSTNDLTIQDTANLF